MYGGRPTIRQFSNSLEDAKPGPLELIRRINPLHLGDRWMKYRRGATEATPKRGPVKVIESRQKSGECFLNRAIFWLGAVSFLCQH
jgi:hypothetical protein